MNILRYLKNSYIVYIMKIMDHIQMAFDCISEPCCDLLNTIFFCCGKRHRCKICGLRYKRLCQLSSHVKYEHNEVFSFGSSKEFKRNNSKLYARVNTHHHNSEHSLHTSDYEHNIV